MLHTRGLARFCATLPQEQGTLRMLHQGQLQGTLVCNPAIQSELFDLEDNRKDCE